MAYRRQNIAWSDTQLMRFVDDEQPPYVTQTPDYVARWGTTPPPVGTVLRWIDGEDTFVAICNGDDRWTTDCNDIVGTSFVSLARIIGNHPCDVAIAWRAVPQVEARPAGDDAVRDWAAQFIPAVTEEGVFGDA